MPAPPWNREINFASALLLHSCLTIILKELLNILVAVARLVPRSVDKKQQIRSSPLRRLQSSYVLDAWTSVISKDADGEQAELYFTNTGFILLACTLAASVALNILATSLVLNILIIVTFGCCWFASIIPLVGRDRWTIIISALRRAGRFIWSDTPFVNFFTLLYIATVRQGNSTLRLQDYITFRAIAVVEWIFMKAKLAASAPQIQEELARKLFRSEWHAIYQTRLEDFLTRESLPYVKRDTITAFQTVQRLQVMLWKTGVGFENGSLQGRLGPALCDLPPVQRRLSYHINSLGVYRISEKTLLIADHFAENKKDSLLARFLSHAHGVLLRRLGKRRVAYVLWDADLGDGTPIFRSSINLVTGVSNSFLKDFEVGESVGQCIIV